MKNKNNPKSKKYRRQSQALARWRGRLEWAVRPSQHIYSGTQDVQKGE